MPIPEQERELTPERLRNIALLIATAILLYLTYRVALPLLPALAWALALAVIAYPMHAFIDRKVHHAWLAAGLTVLVVALLILGPAVFVTERIFTQASAALTFLNNPSWVEEWKTWMTKDPRIAAFLRWVGGVDIGAQVQQGASFFLERAGAVMKGSVGAVLQILIALFILFFLLRDRNHILRALRSLVPLPEDDSASLFRRVADTIHATIFGTVIVSMIQGALGGLMYWFLGLPGPFLWGFVMGMMAMLPTVGTFTVWAPTAIYLAISGSWVKAVVLTVWGVSVVSTIDNLLYPMIVGQRMRLHTAIVFIAVVGGIGAFGASGVVLGPVIVTVTIAVIDMWRKHLARGDAGPL